VGDEVVHTFAERRTALGTLRILTPTDWVLDRLAWFYHARDEQGLEQAVAVAAAHAIAPRAGRALVGQGAEERRVRALPRSAPRRNLTIVVDI
jgi:hypothetical protein